MYSDVLAEKRERIVIRNRRIFMYPIIIILEKIISCQEASQERFLLYFFYAEYIFSQQKFRPFLLF